MTTVEKAVVLGAGTMGAQIAAHLANVGIESQLLDIVPEGAGHGDDAERSRLAREAVEDLPDISPSPLFTEERARLIRPGNVEDDLGAVAGADWVIEAVVERLQPKRRLWERVEAHWQPGTWVSTNTSGLSVAAICEGRSEDFRRHFFGSHFFNPPRYLELLELIPTPDTDDDILDAFREFASVSLGKQVVVARDTPNFIANRLGTYGFQITLEAMRELDLGLDAVDVITGRAMGRPKSATFRTLDLVGIDVYLDVVANLHDNLEDAAERQLFRPPEFIQTLADRGWLGEKSGRGFYYKEKDDDGTSHIYTLDPETMEYQPRHKPAYPSVEQALAKDEPAERLRALLAGSDAASEFAWRIVGPMLLYTAAQAPAIARDLESIDRAMRYGYNWSLGPFEAWDALGLQETAVRLRQQGDTLPDWVETVIDGGRRSFYGDDGTVADWTGEPRPRRERPRVITLDGTRRSGDTIIEKPGATLADLGDGVAGLFFHSPKDAIGDDILRLIPRAAETVAANYRGLVVSGAGEHFSVGANLMQLLMMIQQSKWDQVEAAAEAFQTASMTFKYLQRPVVAAPAGRALGGGAEFCLHCDRVTAAAETYIGLVEVGVGIIPAAGGCKEMLMRVMDRVPEGSDVKPQEFVNWIFETIGTAEVATSAGEARKYGFFGPADAVIMNRQHRVQAAKETVLHMDRLGYRPPVRRKVRVLGRSGRAVLEMGAYQLQQSGYASDHDRKIAGHLARTLTGGDVPAGTEVTEEYLLELEREAFLSLCGEPKSQERMKHMLLEGKPLRN